MPSATRYSVEPPAPLRQAVEADPDRFDVFPVSRLRAGAIARRAWHELAQLPERDAWMEVPAWPASGNCFAARCPRCGLESSESLWAYPYPRVPVVTLRGHLYQFPEGHRVRYYVGQCERCRTICWAEEPA